MNMSKYRAQMIISFLFVLLVTNMDTDQRHLCFVL